MKAKFGAIVVDGRGKIGGHVASKNRAGSYFRTKVTPVNPQTSFQAAVRAVFTALSQAWRGLTSAQIAAWNGAVDRFSRTDVFGDLRNPSGMNLFMRLNLNLSTVQVAPINVPPVSLDVPEVTEFSASGDISDTELEAQFLPTPIPGNTSMVFEATPPISAGVSYVKNKFRIISVQPASANSPVNLWTDYVNKFGTPAAGDRIALRARAISAVSGLASQYRFVFVTFAA